MPNTTWIITADSSRARIFEVADREQRLLEIEDFLNPDARLADRELTTDAHARLRGSGGQSSDREETSAAEHQTDLFSKKLGRFLDKARVENRYNRLYIVAPPKFLGLIRRDLSKEVVKLVKEELPKDLSWLNARDIERYLKNAS
jgi:protein required for attachment to host cells